MQERGPSPSNHYHQDGLLESILSRLRALGVDASSVTREILSGMDEFHLQGAKISEELALKAGLRSGMRVLDVGCGIGGPCRMLADVFGCEVTGIDYTPEYIRTAHALSKLVGLEDQTTFLEASALQLPFADGTFDVVWTQHTQMNIRDKAGLYREVKRVIKPEGRFVYYDIFETGAGAVAFPVPWAEDPRSSYLIPHAAVGSHFSGPEWRRGYVAEHTQNAVSALTESLAKARKGEAPPLGLNLLMQESTRMKLTNLLNGLKAGKLEVFAGTYLHHNNTLTEP